MDSATGAESRATAADGSPMAVDDEMTTRAPVATSAITAQTGVASRFPALASRNFRILWLALIASNVGTWMAATAEGWLVTDLEPRRTAFVLGLIAVSFGLPMLILPPLGGALADRLPRIRLLWTAQLLYMAASATLAIVTLTGRASVGVLIAYAVVTGTVLAVDSPTRHAILPDLVSPAQLTSAISLNSAVFTGAGMIGPAIAGALIPLIGVGGVFAVNTASYLVVLWALTRLDGVPQFSRHGRTHGSVFATIVQGLAYVRRDPLIRALLLLSFASGLLGRSFAPLLPVFARNVYGVDSVAFGFLTAAPGLGTLAGSIWLASRGAIQRKGRWVMIATLGLSAVLLGFALSSWYAPALPLLAVAGLCSTLSSALIATIIQLRVQGELRGRVVGLYTLTVVGVPSLGALLSGAVAQVTGVRIAVGAGAVGLGLLTLLTWLRGRVIRAAA